MNIAIIGANGYIGNNLIQRLLDETDHNIVALSRSAQKIPLENTRLTKYNVSIFDNKLSNYLKDIDVVYYLVHMMAQSQIDFAEAEAKAGEAFNKAMESSRAKRIIYLGGLGRDDDNLSKHLASRHMTGAILRKSTAQVIEFRASMIIGKGSISYDIIVNLVSKLPLLTIPRWSETLSQPIGLSDAISYLVSAIGVRSTKDIIIEIGGPEKISYEEIMRRYAKGRGMKRYFVRIPIIPIAVSAWWLNLFTPRNEAKVGRAMVESLANQMVVTDTVSERLFPRIHPTIIEDNFV